MSHASHPTRLFFLLVLPGVALVPQTPQARTAAPATAFRPAGVVFPNLLKADLLPIGKTQGTFHLNAFVRKDKQIVLRWANSQGEMPTEGVTVWRLKVGDRETAWKELNGRNPVGFFKGPQVKERLKSMNDDAKESLVSLFHSDLQHDPATKTRLTGTPAGTVKRFKDLTPDKVAEQYKLLRNGGRLSRADLQMLHAHADADPAAADLFGLGYTDKPGSGKWRYKIVVRLPEGGSVEAVYPGELDSAIPTPVPTALNLAAKSGNGKVLLNWEAPASTVIAGFNVYRAETVAGPWKRLNDSPVKIVKLEVEDPETAMRRVVSNEAALEKEMRKSSGQPISAGKVAQMRTQAGDAVSATGAASLSPALAASINEGVASGRLPKAGLISPASVYSDDKRSAGNSDLVDEHSYVYRVSTVDITGGETAKETAPLVTGTPKDLEPPRVPGRPRLQTQSEAFGRLRGAQALRAKDAHLRDLDTTIASKLPLRERALTPFLLSDAATIPSPTQSAPAAPSPDYAALSLGDAKRMRLSRLVATMPSKELAEAAEASLLHSKPDGSAPPAKLAWEPSTDADLKGYEVYRATDKGPLQKMASTTEPTWTDTGLEVGQAYRYAISAVDKLGNESARSDEGLVEVSDSRLKEKLAIKKLDGKATTALPVGIPMRELTRPKSRVMKAAGADFLKAQSSALKVPSAVSSVAVMSTFQAPKDSVAPKVSSPKGLAMTAPASHAKVLDAAKVEPSAMKFTLNLKAITRVRPLGINFMLVEPLHPKDIYVQLEWDRPMEGRPLEYLIYQAPQKFELKYSPRAIVTPTQGMRMVDQTTLSLSTAGLSTAGSSTAKAGSLTGAMSAPMSASSASGVGQAPRSGVAANPGVSSHSGQMDATQSGSVSAAAPMPTGFLVASTKETHFTASRGLVASAGGGLRIAPEHKDHMVQSLVSIGPGEFTRTSEKAVTGEHFAVAFPAEVGQYGGATFYFRIQARTKEFGRTIDGPMSDIIEVKLPDVVPPPMPAPGAINITEINEESFKVGLDWTDVTARDLAGYFVERQTMNYTIVDGEAMATTPMGDPQRLQKAPQAAHAFSEANAPGGYQRYFVRSADKTGNVSDANGYLDIFVPGEPVPAAPTGLSLAGNRLNWKPSPLASGYSVWRSFSGLDEDFEQISGFLGANETGFNLPPQGTLHLKVVARSTTGMHQTASAAVVRTAALPPSP